MTEPIAYLNGQIVPVSQAALSVFDLGLVSGVAVTEMARTFRHVLFQLDKHLDRLAHSLDVLKLDPKCSRTELEALCHRIVDENVKWIPANHDLGLILFVTAGQNLTYIGRTPESPVRTPSVCVHTFPLPFELWAETYEAGLHLVTPSVRSIPDAIIDSRIKHRSRLHWYLADLEVKKSDPSAMALLTDDEGYLTETATGNLCVVEGNTIVTPESHVLKGVSRDFVAELATTLGLTFGHTRLTAEDLARGGEAFLTSTPHCLLPVTRFNGQPVGSGRPGPVFQRLLKAWGERVGVDVAAQMQAGAGERLKPA
ncbi:aminotransferase class IV [Schlesneria paludicola]|uniref:aminotransferase class IV n=1 Tax=Schlesneria paludicola TaxID=360056 RepID=UPI00029B4187|nr:aminotransferase class IV [Schlesneria paludicola]